MKTSIVNRMICKNGIWKPIPILRKFRGMDLQLFAGVPWYVNNSVAVSGDGSSWANAWKNFSNINWSSVDVGDYIYISGGATEKNYYETLSIGRSGQSGNRIIIDSGANSPYPTGHSGTIIIDGQLSRGSGISFNGTNYVTTKNMTIKDHTGGSGSVAVGNTSYATLENLNITHPRGRGVNGGSNDHIVIRGCYLDSTINDYPIEEDNISLFYNVYDVTIENCVMWQGANSTLGAAHDDLIHIINGAGTTIIRNNFCSWYPNVGSGEDQSTMLTYPTGTWYIYNNVFVHRTGDEVNGVVFGWEDLGGDPDPDLYFWNNLMYSRNTSVGSGLRIGSMYGTVLKEFYNNIYIADGPGYAIINEWGGVDPDICDHNCYYIPSHSNVVTIANNPYTWTSWRNAGAESNGLNEDPKVDASDEYRLQSDSPCIDWGKDLSSHFSNDRDGKTRPSGLEWDIGPHEYGAQQILEKLLLVMKT